MKKIIVGVVLVALVVLGLFVFIGSDDKKNSVNTEPTNTTSQNNSSNNNQNVSSNQNGTYTEYSEQAVADANGTKLLFFHAPWCPQCRALESSIQNGNIPKDVTIFKVDYDSNQNLRQKYGVTIQTTIVAVDSNGNLIKKYVAYDEPTLNAVVKNIL